MILVTGGTRSGKSSTAERLAKTYGGRVLYVATAEPGDDEMRLRMLGQYFSAAGTAPEALAGMMKSERERWAQVIKAAGVQAE